MVALCSHNNDPSSKETAVTLGFRILIEAEDPRGSVESALWTGETLSGNITFSCKRTIREYLLEDGDSEYAQAKYKDFEEKGWLYYHEIISMYVQMPSGAVVQPKTGLEATILADLHDEKFLEIAHKDWPIYVAAVDSYCRKDDRRCEGESDAVDPNYRGFRFYHHPQSCYMLGEEGVDYCSKKGGFMYFDSVNYKGGPFANGYLGTVTYFQLNGDTSSKYKDMQSNKTSILEEPRKYEYISATTAGNFSGLSNSDPYPTLNAWLLTFLGIALVVLFTGAWLTLKNPKRARELPPFEYDILEDLSLHTGDPSEEVEMSAASYAAQH